MKTFKKNYLRFSVLILVSLFLTASVSAQHGRRHYGNNSRNYSYRNSNHYSRPHVSVSIGPRYNYRPYYRPRPVYRRPYAYMHYGPSFGFRLNLLPVGYSRVYVGTNPYYYNQGVYYRPYTGGGYEVTAPPLGAVVSQLPPDASVTVVDGQKYYQVGGTFYQEEMSEDNRLMYRVVGTDGYLDTNKEETTTEETIINDNVRPPVGTRYETLPTNSEVEVINQQKYFVSPEGVYFREVIVGNKILYEVTSVQ